MKQIYSDKDYLDKNFKELFDEVHSINKLLKGNGEVGLIDRQREDSLKIAWIIRAILVLAAVLVITHAQPTAEIFTKFIEKRIF